MEKRRIIIMTIISTIISMVIILCSYFGITRYYLLRFQSSDSYISTYPTIRKTDTNVTVSISTTPKRIEKIRPMINSILDQTVRVDRIILVVDQDAIDRGYTLPSYLNKIAILFPTGKDYGSGCCNSMVPMLLTEKECDTTIIALLDDVIYGKDYIETDALAPGELGAVAKVEDIGFDCVLHDSHDEDHIHLRPMQFPQPMVGLAVQTQRKGDEQRLFEVLAEVAAEVAANSSGVHAIAASHRVGPLRVGDAALVVAVSADHRAAAFGTCAVVVERVKEAIPVWKHQFFADGSDEWVNWA